MQVAHETPVLLVQRDAIETPVVLALDIGSSSARAALVDSRGRWLAKSLRHVAYKTDTVDSRYGSLDPEELTLSVEQLLDQITTLANAQKIEIVGVGISTFWHSLIGLDARQQPLTPIYSWADIRSADAARELARRLDPDAYHARTGTLPHPSYPAAKLIWLQETDAELVENVERWVSFGEYLFLRFFGEATASVSMASATGLFDQKKLCLDEATLDAIGVKADRLSAIGDDPAPRFTGDYAKRWPALANARWYPAYGDGACANVGSGAFGKDHAGMSVGTSGAMRVLWEGEPVAPPAGLWLYRLDARRVLLGGALSEGGNLFEWVIDRFKLPERDELARTVAAIAPDSHGLTWLPFLAGERSPGWHANARATLSGLTLHTSPEEILRAGLEAITYRFALIAELLDDHLPSEHTIIGSGNALSNDRAWPHIMADALGHPLITSTEPEASLRGAALVALERLDAVPNLKQVATLVLEGAERYEPNAENHRIYEKAIERQKEMYRRLMG
jgi:gluconokinase